MVSGGLSLVNPGENCNSSRHPRKDTRRMFLLKTSVFPLLAGVLLVCAAPASAQQSFGSIGGVVHDSQGAVIANAKVVLTNQDQGAVMRELISSSEGTFDITPLPPAT